MKHISTLLTAFSLGLALQCSAQTWVLNYGTEKDKVSVYNSNTAKDFAEDAPYGPMSFRVDKQQLKLLDSVSGRLLILDKKNKIRASVQVNELQSFKLLEDFAFVEKEKCFWVADAVDRNILKISSKGDILVKITPSSLPGGKILQINQIEVDSQGNLYIGDCGLSRLSVFNKDGKFLRDYEWHNSGFAIDKNNNLHLIDYIEKMGHFHKTYSLEGNLLSSEFIGIGDHTNPRLWTVNNDNIYMSFIPPGGFRGIIKLYEIGKNAKIKRYQDIIPATNMNRYIDIYEDKVYTAVANFATAPKGNYTIKASDGWSNYEYPVPFASSLQITKEPLVKIPDDIANDGLLGLRTAKERVVIANKSGNYITCNLKTGETFKGFKKANAELIDFDLVLDQMIYLDSKGVLGGRVLSFWPKKKFDACRIEVCDEGLILSGGQKAYFLSKDSKDFKPIEIEGFTFAQPIPRGFVWTLEVRENGLWGADLNDCYGQQMGQVYTFNKDYNPVSIEVGPEGIEGELVVSDYENGVRKLMFIGNNGRMFWKIDAPEKICPRDVGFDHNSNLIFIEKIDDEIWLTRWKMTVPEG